jgi:translation initiation factor IF-1
LIFHNNVCISQGEKMARDDLIEFEGQVEATPGGGLYRVRAFDKDGQPGDHLVIASLCGKMRENKIRVVVGDKVVVAVSPYDLKNGRIMRRERAAPR